MPEGHGYTGRHGKKLFWGLFVLLSFLAPVTLAQEAGPTRRGPDPLTAPAPDEQTIALRAQLDVMRKYDEMLLSTVYWSLGTIALIAVLLTGYSWYTNYRVYERDREFLRAEMRSLLQQELANARNTLEDTAKRNSDRALDAEKAFLADAKEQLAHIETSSAEASEIVKQSLTRRISKMQYDFLKLEIDFQVFSKTPEATILRSYIELFEVGLELEFSSGYVDAMKSIEALMKKGARLWSDDVSMLDAALNRVRPEFAPQAEIIRQLIPSSLRSY